VVNVEALPNAEAAYFGGPEIAEEYVIQGETMDNIALAIQNKKETTAFMTPAQMAEEIASIVSGDDLPNAENSLFGTTGNEEFECGILGTFGSQRAVNMSRGYLFTTKVPIGIYGLRCPEQNAWCKLIKSTGEWITSVQCTTLNIETGFYEGFLSSSINLDVGTEYIVFQKWGGYGIPVTSSTINDKITNVVPVVSQNNVDPTKDSTTSELVIGGDLIIGAAITESVSAKYAIANSTITAIANEVKRITGTSGVLTTDMIITALQGIEATN